MTGELPYVLPSPREAMRNAVEHAHVDDLEGARLWLDLARELRVGSARAGVPIPRPLDYGVDLGGDLGTLATRADLATAGLVPFGDKLTLIPEREPTRTVVSHEDRIFDYFRGQQASPSAEAVLFAGDRQRCIDQGMLATADERSLLHEILDRAGRLSVPAEEPAYRSADTQILDPVPVSYGTRCGNCGRGIELRLGEVPEVWVHHENMQSVCPVNGPNDTHTYATPLVDRRG